MNINWANGLFFLCSRQFAQLDNLFFMFYCEAHSRKMRGLQTVQKHNCRKNAAVRYSA